MFAYLEGKNVIECGVGDYIGMNKVLYNDRKIIKTDINNYSISTVFLPIDHNMGVGEPLWFETMIFDNSDNRNELIDEYCKRYETYDDAVQGHLEAINYVIKELIKWIYQQE